LSYPLESLKVDSFLMQCEAPRCGFTEIPGTSFVFLEFIYGGLLAAETIGYRPRYADACIDFIQNCQTKSGGFPVHAQ
jgi:hypothetical protein